MSIKDEIDNSMTRFSLDTENGEVSAEFAFDAGFAGFQGHFPGNPILPGVCQVEMALAVLEKAMERQIELKTLTRGKFLNTVTPNEKVLVSGTFAANEDETEVSAKFALTKTNGEDGANISVSRLTMTLQPRSLSVARVCGSRKLQK